jgi:hypothetical protein
MALRDASWTARPPTQRPSVARLEEYAPVDVEVARSDVYVHDNVDEPVSSWRMHLWKA